MEKTLKRWLKRLKIHESTVSTILGLAVVIVLVVLVVNAFRGGQGEVGEEALEESATPSEEGYRLSLEEKEGSVVPAGLPVEHTVARGEHLWMLSEKYYGNGYNWVDIAKDNNLENPGLLFSGQRLTIPKVALRVATQVLQASQMEAIEGSSYTVVKGDSLWSIAVRAYQDGYQWPRIYSANKDVISDPNLIEVGMEIKLPR